MIADNKTSAIGGDASNGRLFASTGYCNLTPAIKVECADTVRGRVDHVRAMASWFDGDKARLMMNADRGDDAIGIRVDHRDCAGLSIGDVDLIANWIHGQTTWIGAHLKGSVLTQIDEIKHRDGVGAAVADVGVLAISGGNVREAAAAATRDAEQENGCG